MNSEILETIRASIADYQLKLSGIDEALADKATAERRIDLFLDDVTSSLDLDISGFYVQKPGVYEGGIRLEAPVDEPEFEGDRSRIDFFPVLSTVFRSHFKKWLTERVEQEVDGQWGPSASEIESTKKKINFELLRLEIEEEQTINELNSKGIETERRGQLENPLVVALINPKTLLQDANQ